MKNTTDDLIKALKRDFGGRWQIWHVPVYIGPDRWCARPWSAARADITTENIVADSAEGLRRRIEDREAGQ
jgi:hypothetical protein